jgi:hypothetical protein
MPMFKLFDDVARGQVYDLNPTPRIGVALFEFLVERQS